MKKIYAILLAVVSLVTLVGCDFNDWNEPEECAHIWMPATFESPEKCKLCGMTLGEKLPPAPEWGFNYLYEMGNCLISINAYSGKNSQDAYVIANGDCIRFENGYMLRQSFDVENGQCVFGSSGNPDKYTVVNNDNLDINNGYESFYIERETISGRDNFVCFVRPKGMFRSEAWYVPYSLIDWDRGAEVISSTEYEQEIKLYLIN